MSISIYTEITVSEKFRKLIQKQEYEKYVFMILQRSKKIFAWKTFTYISEQSHGESDFVDQDGLKYEAKLLIDTKQGSLIGEKKNDIKEWIQDVINERIQYGQCIRERDKTGIDVSKTRLYHILIDRLNQLKRDENALFFVPFPVVMDFEGSIFRQFAADFLQAVYAKASEEDLIGNREIYFIYPSAEPRKYVLRDAHFHREYINVPELDEYIVFETY